MAVSLQVKVRDAGLSLQPINQSIKTHFYSAICRERIRGAYRLYTGTVCDTTALLQLQCYAFTFTLRVSNST